MYSFFPPFNEVNTHDMHIQLFLHDFRTLLHSFRLSIFIRSTQLVSDINSNVTLRWSLAQLVQLPKREFEFRER